MQLTASPDLPEIPAPQAGRWLVRFCATEGVQESRVHEVSPSGTYCRASLHGPNTSAPASDWFQITRQVPTDGLTIQLVEWLGDSLPVLTQLPTGWQPRHPVADWQDCRLNQAPPFFASQPFYSPGDINWTDAVIRAIPPGYGTATGTGLGPLGPLGPLGSGVATTGSQDP